MSFISRGSSIVFVSEHLSRALNLRMGASLDVAIARLRKLDGGKTWDFWESKIYSKKYEHLQLNSLAQLHIYKQGKFRYFIFTREASDLSIIRKKQEDIIKKLLSISPQKIKLIDDAFRGKNYGEGNLIAPVMIPTIGGRIYFESRENVFCEMIRKYKKELVRLMIFYINQLASENGSLFSERIYYLNRKINHIIQNLQRKSCHSPIDNNRQIYFDVQKTISEKLNKSPNASYHRVTWINSWKDKLMCGNNGLMINLCMGIAFLIGEYPMQKIDMVLDYHNNGKRICIFGLPRELDKTLVQCLTNHKNINYETRGHFAAVYFLL
jgi:hypothetical protein